MNWTIYINGTAVEEPQGLSDLVINIQRDEDWHGVFFEASSTKLQFYGNGAALLQAEKQANGLAATATFRAEVDCGTSVDVITGVFDFGTYIEHCGVTCTVEIAIEKSGCIMTMRNRYDQKVDMQKTTAFDNTTLLPVYDRLDNAIQLTAQQLALGNEAEMSDAAITEVISDSPNWVDSDGFNNYIGWIAPALPIITNESLGTFNAAAIIELAGPLEGVPNRPPYPSFPNATGTAELSGNIVCALEDTEAEFRMKGHSTVVFSGGAAVGLTLKLFRLPAGLDGTVAVNWIEEYATPLAAHVGSGTINFDTGVVTVPLTINQGDFIYWGISTRGDSLNNITSFALTEDPETYFKLLTAATCEPTTAIVSLINEAGSRIIESITDMCMSMKSDYYGRTDSQPFVSDEDGCGSLRVISNGLKIRNATPSNHFITLQEFFTGLRGIDNIGMGIEANTVTNFGEWLRVEPVEYFYQDVKLMSLPFIPDADNTLNPQYGYSGVKIGYQKWEVERVNGLNEFNSNKEFRTSLKTINNVLDATSNFIAGGIPIEVTRQQSFAVSGSADTKYDNDTFIICVTRDCAYYVNFLSTGNKMFIVSPGDGSQFAGLTSITIAGSVSNNGLRNISSITILPLPGNIADIIIEFSGGVTTDEFGASVTFTGITYPGYCVEKGNIDNAANIFSPLTAYNWRIRPMYNLMRWFKSVAQTYVNLQNSLSKLFFASGTGNYIAEGELPAGDPCKLENKVLAENANLAVTDFAVAEVPIYKPETMQFEYPLSIAEYLNIKANPYGYLEVQCGNGSFEKAFIKSIAYKPVAGTAQFNLIKKWQ